MLSVFKKWIAQAKGGKIEWDDLEAVLIQSDLGLPLTHSILKSLKESPLSRETVSEAAAQSILGLWPTPPRQLFVQPGKMSVWLIVGVNGTGKTTSIAKLAHHYQKTGKKVHLIAADTFRAAAIDQLKVWADRTGSGFFAGKENGDPAAAAYQGLENAKRENADLVLIDTAGRLHNKENLMRELEKVKRVIQKLIPDAPHEILLVLDGTNGNNAVEQARQFHSFLNLTGLIVTKLDSSSKGGAIAAIKAEHKIDPVFIGSGEGLDDFREFDPKAYVSRFFAQPTS
ncbi:MAG: signal recognition particle-docking protein FtsY [Methylacidiphilales bacterium]|nr:signal recognition particle-docking protein FtsY [Candidatus Methylacidiphilales bacterium]